MASYINLGNGGFPAPVTNPYTISGTVSVGDAVYLSSALTVARADADNAAARPPIGVVAGISGSTASVAAAGSVASGLSGLTAGAVYWLSTTPGQMTTTQPGSDAYVMGVAISETQMLVGTIPAALGSGGGGSVTGAVEIVEFAIGTNSTYNSTTVLPTGTKPQFVQLQITTAYTPGTTISIGYAGSASFLMATGNNLPGTLGVYSLDLFNLTWTNNTIRVTIGGSPVVGAGFVRVGYVTTVNT